MTRTLARGIFGISAAAALLGGGVMAFGQAQLSPQTASTGDGSFSFVADGAPSIPLYDNNVPTIQLAGTLTNTSPPGGQTEMVSGTVSNIQEAWNNNATDPAVCETFVSVPGNVSGTVGSDSPTSGPVAVAVGTPATVQVYLTLQPTGPAAAPTTDIPITDSPCATQVLSYDLVLQSSVAN
jgi:hypothetical protein